MLRHEPVYPPMLLPIRVGDVAYLPNCHELLHGYSSLFYFRQYPIALAAADGFFVRDEIWFSPIYELFTEVRVGIAQRVVRRYGIDGEPWRLEEREFTAKVLKLFGRGAEAKHDPDEDNQRRIVI